MPAHALGNISHISHSSHVRSHALTLAVAIGLAIGLAIGGAWIVGEPGVSSAAPARPRVSSVAAYPSSEVTFVGHGFGPGIGMGQWGNFGYAVHHRTYQWILGHFYSGTKLVTGFNPASVKVAITENAGGPVVVTSPWRFYLQLGKSSFRFPGGSAARATLSGSTWTVQQASGCGSTRWTTVRTGLHDPVFYPVIETTTMATATRELLTICRDDGQMMTVRGQVQAFDETGKGGGARTINSLTPEEYLADSVPSEAAAIWGQFGPAGGPQGQDWGFQSLEVQAVAARTFLQYYEQSGGWGGYASICDFPVCQSYPGILNENSLATKAVVDTTSQVLQFHGLAAPIQYSASSGGYTAATVTWNNKPVFPAVLDEGDAICIQSVYFTCNPDHSWTGSASVSSIEQAFPSIGTLTSIAVLGRTGPGQWGGRAISVEVQGTAGTAKVPPWEIEALMSTSCDNCSSNWFSITNSPAPHAVRSMLTIAAPQIRGRVATALGALARAAALDLSSPRHPEFRNRPLPSPAAPFGQVGPG